MDSNGYVYTSNSFKGWVLDVDLEYSKELHELHNDYPSAPNKTEIKIETLSEYQLKIADLYNIPISYVKKLMPNMFNEKTMWLILKTYNFTSA